jgi:hypothetical protein
LKLQSSLIHANAAITMAALGYKDLEKLAKVKATLLL